MMYLLISLFAIFLKINDVGSFLSTKTSIPSTLDLSWQSDSIERLLHGFILGKDFIFTYGPLFQLLISLPSLVFHVPSYISVALEPVTLTLIFLPLVIIFTKILIPKKEQILFFTLLLFVVGLLSVSEINLLRIFLPLFYIVIFVKYYQPLKFGIVSLGIAILPTFFGLFSYDLFISCLVLSIIFCAYSFFQYKNKTNTTILVRNIISFLLSTLLIQVLFSLVFTRNFNYITYSWDTIKNYYFVMSVPWAKDRSNILFLFPLFLIWITYVLVKDKVLDKKTKLILCMLIFASLLDVKTALIRSDAGHIIKGVYPSIISSFISVFFLGRKRKELFVTGVLLFIFIPYKPNYVNSLAPKNLVNVIKLIHNKPTFSNLYSFKQDPALTKLIETNKENVFIYPYDSFLLNIYGATYNSFALQLYDYSNSLTEKITVDKLNANAPHYIILGIDTKGALALDDIPNFTRNPLFAQWVIQHYGVVDATKNYLILRFNPSKHLPASTCIGYRMNVDLSRTQNIIDKLIKSPIYYLDYNNTRIRLAYTNTARDYLVFPDSTTANGLTQWFNATNQTQISKVSVEKINQFFSWKKEKLPIIPQISCNRAQ